MLARCQPEPDPCRERAYALDIAVPQEPRFDAVFATVIAQFAAPAIRADDALEQQLAWLWILWGRQLVEVFVPHGFSWRG